MEDYIEMQAELLARWIDDCILADILGMPHPELCLLTEEDVQAIIDGVTVH